MKDSQRKAMVAKGFPTPKSLVNVEKPQTRLQQVEAFKKFRIDTRNQQLKDDEFGSYKNEYSEVDDRKAKLFGQSARLDFTITSMKRNKKGKGSTWGFTPKRLHMNRYELGNRFAEEYDEVVPKPMDKKYWFQIGWDTYTTEDMLDEIANDAKKRKLMTYKGKDGGLELLKQGVFEASSQRNPFTIKIGEGTYVIGSAIPE